MNLSAQETCPLTDDTRQIPLTQGQFALVDVADFEWLSQWKWYAHWSPTSRSFYAVRNVYVTENAKRICRNISMAREILGLKFGDPRHADHINHNTLENTRGNLRIADRSESMRNRRVFSSNVCGYKGVHWRGPRDGRAGYWIAAIQLNKKRLEKGTFRTAEEAHAFRCEWAKEVHGAYAWVK